MKKIFILLTLLIQLFALDATKQNILELKSKHIPIIDIRTFGEWQETGVIPKALKITFFTRNGGLNPKFFDELTKNKINKNSKFALICRTGHRSRVAVAYLKQQGYKNIIDLKGGMYNLFKSLLKGLDNARK